MDRNQAKEFYPILQAFAEGKTIETRRKPTTDNGVTKDGWYEFNDWTEMKELEYWVNVEFRIKPEAKYRPFANAEECWAEMLKHKPFGWVNDSDGSKFTIETIASSDSSIFISDEGAFYLGEMFEKFKFADGTPFGVKVEEE